jgi:hypothetical protein
MDLKHNAKHRQFVITLAILLLFVTDRYCYDWRYTIPQESQITIGVEKTACFGSCPAYQLKIFENGTVSYLGIYFGGALGTRKGNIGTDKVRQLAAQLEKGGYFGFDNFYTDQTITCSSTTLSYLKIGNKEKHIEHYTADSRAPAELSELEDLIDKTANSPQWTKPCGLQYPYFCGTGPLFWMVAALPLVIAIWAGRPFFRKQRRLWGILIGLSIVGILWLIFVILLYSNFLGFWDTDIGIKYSILGYLEMIAVIPIGYFLGTRPLIL